MATLVILTASFPYEGGEQFIEAEISYWTDTKFKKIFIFPSSAQGLKRFCPDNITILNHRSDFNNKFEKIYFAFLSLFSLLFWREINSNFFLKKLNLLNIYYALAKTAATLRYTKYLKKSIKDIDSNITVYSYWNDITYYSACVLKRQGVVGTVVSRAHGFDVYEERHSKNYIPLKRQFSQDVDKIFLISNSALSYYKNKYDYPLNKLEVARLGVVLPKINYKCFSINSELSILSLSYCLPIKRIDKIIDAINYFSLKYNVKVKWTHIGAGELFNDLRESAINISMKNKKFKAYFLGQLSNEEVHNWLSENSVNAFINASETEGVPVSIMEAMSYGIPAIAPNIGGISELINEENGFLMSSKADISEILTGLEKILFSKNDSIYRENARKTVMNKYNSNKNYKEFIHKVEELALLK